jgi:hypothetical protein
MKKEYIDKAAIENILRNLWQTDNAQNSEQRVYYNKALQEVQCHLDALEVKEVDLEKEFDKCCENYIFDDEWDVYTARHFFKLGFQKAQKGE